MGKHAIMVIKNEEGKYLQYYDNNWDSYLFPNCKMPNGDEASVVKNNISEQLNVDEGIIDATLVGQKQHKKFSESAKTEKDYLHYFYNVNLNTKLKDEDFELNGVKYKWFSYPDLLNDKRIQEVNSDIVTLVRAFNIQ